MSRDGFSVTFLRMNGLFALVLLSGSLPPCLIFPILSYPRAIDLFLEVLQDTDSAGNGLNIFLQLS